MNNKIEVIGIDHGWSNIKTSSQVFVTGVKEITTEPALFDGVLEYKGRYYKVGGSSYGSKKRSDSVTRRRNCRMYQPFSFTAEGSYRRG